MIDKKDVCASKSHDYAILDGGWFKYQPDNPHKYDQFVSYATLYCKKCGTTKEITQRRYK